MDSSNNKKNIAALAEPAFKTAVLLGCAVAVGLICGVLGGAFAKSIGLVTALRAEYPWLIYLLPVGGLVSVGIYKLAKTEGIGTDRALESARGEAKTPILLVPVVFAASVITHLFGGSAGKEGAALQIGSGVAEAVSRVSKADDKTRSVLSVCGMAALFSAAFGTPVGACIFSLEVAVVGGMNALAVFPAFVSSITAFVISTAMGVVPERFHIDFLPDFGVEVLLKVAAEAIIVSLAAGAFCHMLHGGEKLFGKLFKNPFIRIFVGGCVVIVLTVIFGTDYNGGGMFVAERIFEEGTVRPEAFLLKMIFTVVTVCSGYKGGEVLPSFFIGATLGAVLSPILGLPIGFCAAIGMTAFFGGVTNCPIAAAVIAVELFGAEGFALFAAAAFSSRVFSGRVRLYNRQKTL